MKQQLTTISIDGKTLPTFESLNLQQRINDHHQFEIIVDQETIEKRGAHTIEKSKNWLGKSIVITFDGQDFLGVITNVKLKHNKGFYGEIVISGYSKTVLLEGGKHMQSWLKKDLRKIVKEIIEDAGISAEVKPKYTSPYEYQAQYQETHFQFLQRLAKQHSEWLYYDGVKLIFGKPTLKSPIELEYGADIDDIDISINAFPSKQSIFSYHPLDDKKHDSTTRDAVSGLNELGNFAFGVSTDLYPIVPNGFSSARVTDKSEIEGILNGQQSSAVSEANLLRAKSTHQGLTIGTVIKMSAVVLKHEDEGTKSYGEYIITSINHNATGLNEYSNSFEAVSSGVEFLATPDVSFPVAQTQIATVLSNEDPEKKGRVQVQFQWQTGEMKTAWVRMMSPDAGSSDKVGVNRGFVFIPEKDDQVMVGFRYNDPNRPFVLGSMFSGTTGAGGDDENKTKKITTRSGNTIIFDDDAGSITVSDAKQNLMSFDGEGNIVVSSSASISLVTGKSSLTMDSDGMIAIQGEEISISATTKATLESSKDVIVNGTESATMDSPKLATVSSAKEVNITGTAKTIVSSSASTEIQGTIIKLN